MEQMQPQSASPEEKKHLSNGLLRVITGAVYVLVLLGFFVGKVLVHKLFFDVLIVLFSVLGTYEMIRAFGDKLHRSQKLVAMVFSQLCVIAYIAADIVYTDFLGVGFPDDPLQAIGRNYAPHIALVFFILGIAVIFGVLVYGHDRMSLESVGYTLVAFLYPSVFLVIMAACNHLAFYSDAAIAFVFVISPVADSFAYTVGSGLGKRFPAKLAPHVSPKKTLVGGLGGLIGGAVGGVMVFFIYYGLTRCVQLTGIAQFTLSAPEFIWKELPFFIGIGVVISAFSQFGDLVESAFKRKLGIKDMGNLLPGHGGVLDRIDSSLYASLIVAFIFVLRIMIAGAPA